MGAKGASKLMSKPDVSIPKSSVPNLTSRPATSGSSGISTADRGICHPPYEKLRLVDRYTGKEGRYLGRRRNFRPQRFGF